MSVNKNNENRKERLEFLITSQSEEFKNECHKLLDYLLENYNSSDISIFLEAEADEFIIEFSVSKGKKELVFAIREDEF